MTIDPGKAGLSAARLEHLTRHLNTYVDNGRYPFVACRITRNGQSAYAHVYGDMDRERSKTAGFDTVARAYSMTKPVVAVAALQLFEQGKYLLDDPVSCYIQSLAKPNILVGGDAENPQVRPADSEITIRQIFTHTSGFTYGFTDDSPVSKLYQKNNVIAPGAKYDLEEFCRRLGEMPLLAEPGTEWNYSVSTDVLGRLVEVISGQTLTDYMQENIFQPLGMADTGFQVREDQQERFAACYAYDAEQKLSLDDDPANSRYLAIPTLYSGGGGLVSAIGDFERFAQMLCNGGSLDGSRILGPRTVGFMSKNHLPGDMASMGQPKFSESSYEGIGFGLGVSVMLDPAKAQLMTSVGEFGWGGMASTVFWVDPLERMTVVFFTQLRPSSTYPVRREMRSLIYQAIEA